MPDAGHRWRSAARWRVTGRVTGMSGSWLKYGMSGIHRRPVGVLSGDLLMPIRSRFSICFVVGAVLGLAMFQAQAPPDPVPSDWRQIYLGSRAMIGGQNPYTAVDSARVQPYPIVYPGTAFVAAAPLALLPWRVAVSVWCGLSGGLLAYVRTRRGLWGLLGLVSAPFFNGYVLGQWSPIFTAATALPWLGILWVAKPTIGLSMFAGWPSRRAAIGGAALILLSLALVPHWPAEMRARLPAVPFFQPLVTRFAGSILLLALLRWRRPEARMLAALALVPQTGWIYELIPLLLIPRTARQMLALVLLGWVGFLLGRAQHLAPASFGTLADAWWPYLLAFGYLPALWLVLQQERGDRVLD
jgi:hypothetical protein